MLYLWKFFLDNRAFTYFLVVLTLCAGVYALATIPKESTPEVTIPIAVVNTSYFGASPSDVETLVTNKIEDQIANVSGIEEYSSVSQNGFSSITVTFEQGEDIDERVDRLKEEVDQVVPDLPQDGNEPQVTKVDFSSQPVFTISLVSDMPLYSFKQVVEDFEDALLEIEGVAQVSVSGIPEREIALVFDNRKLEQYNFDFNSIVGLLSNSNVSLPGGSIEIDNIEYPVDVESRFNTVEELPHIPLRYTEDSVVVVSDIAQVVNGFAPQDTYTRVGYPGSKTLSAVTVNVSKKNGGDITQLTKEIHETMSQLSEDTLRGVETVITYDAGQDIIRDLGELSTSGLQTVILVFIILLIFVGARESVIAALSIPLSFLLAFVAFIVVGNTINFISLFALILSIGILVDSAIVVTEGINTKVREGMRRQEAALATVQEFGLPLLAGTMTTIAVFFPLLFLSGIIGQFIRGIPFTVILVLLASIFVSLGFITVFCASFLKNREYVQAHELPWATRAFARLETQYRRVLQALLHNAFTRRMFQVLISLVMVLAVCLVAVGLVKVEFFPAGDIEYAYIRVELDNAATLEDTMSFTRKVEELVSEYDYIESFVSTIGSTSQYEEEVREGDKYANITLNVLPEYQSKGLALVDDLSRKLSGASYEYAELVAQGGGPPTGAAVDVSFVSSDTDALRRDVRKAQEALTEIPGVENIATTLPGNTSGLRIAVDRNAANRFGVSIYDIAQSIRGATDGVEVFTLTEKGEDISVLVRNRLAEYGSPDAVTKNITPDHILSLSVSNNRGESILLGNMVSVSIKEADKTINHQDGERFIGITASVDESYNANDIRAEYQAELQDIVSSDVSYSFGGEQQEQNESFTEVFVALLAGIFLMFAILILQFGRWRQVLIVMSVLVYALAGVLIGLFISGNALSFPAMLGTIALFGIVVNNSLILVSVFNHTRREHPDWSIDYVITEGAVSRLRPIILTTVTTIIGVTPLLYASAIWAPIAYAIIFGLLFCVFVTLALVPILYRRFEGFATGSWREVGGWFINLVMLLIVPTALLVFIVVLSTQTSLPVTLGLYTAFVVAITISYVVNYVRKHK